MDLNVEVQGVPKIKPVFFKAKDFPGKLTTLQICRAAESTAGVGEVEGAQCIKGLWRIYLNSEAARNTLLTEKLCLEDVTVDLYSTNPYLKPEPEGHYMEVHDMPLSYDNAEIIKWLLRYGFSAATEVKYKYVRDEMNKLTNFKTGVRFLHVRGPIEALPRKAQIGLFTVSLWSPDQPKPKRDPKCSKCLQRGHLKEDCPSEVVCLRCKQPGHMKGQCQVDDSEPEGPDDGQEQLPVKWEGFAETWETEDDVEKGAQPQQVQDSLPSASNQQNLVPRVTQEVLDRLARFAFAPRGKSAKRRVVSVKRSRRQSESSRPNFLRRKISAEQKSETDEMSVTSEVNGQISTTLMEDTKDGEND